MVQKRFLFVVAFLLLSLISVRSYSQCGGIMEPGFAFLTSSRGCAPFTVNIQTLYLSSVPGTQYFINWGDGTPEETYTQVAAGGVNLVHTYPNTSVNCGYDVIIDASNACNPRGSVVPINTQVIVWTNDVISINPSVFRVCQGYATDVLFRDDSDWNCFPRATRENNEPRWIQWLYGTGPMGMQIPGIGINSLVPGGFPYLDPAPAKNPIYPVLAPGQISLPINVPVTTPADLGKEFIITLKNWNQCNAYDNNLVDGNPFNPVSGNLINGDNAPQITTARIVIVPAPQPDFLTRLGDAAGPVQAVFCVGDNIYFDNETPAIAGASFANTWQFFDNPTGVGAPLTTSTNTDPTFAYPTSGQKLIRLSVRDQNAAGNCVALIEKVISISPSLIAQIQITDFTNNPIVADFCQNSSAPLNTFEARFHDTSLGMVTPTTQWRWEFYNEANVLVRQEPPLGAFSSVALGPFDEVFINRGTYRVRLIVRDNVTSCETVDEVQVRVFENPVPLFTATRVCEGQATSFVESSTLQAINGEVISLREWDFDYDGVTFTKDPAYDNQSTFTRSLGSAGTYQVALRVTSSISGCTEMLVMPVRVDALPLASFTPDVTSGCSVLTVNFTNTSVLGQPDVIDRFVWEVDERQGLGFVPIGTQSPSDPLFTNQFTYSFENSSTVNKVVDVRLHAMTINTCETVSGAVAITIFPGTRSGFLSTNYSPFNDNCSPQTINFSVDAETQSLNPTEYRWRISDTSGILDEISSGTIPDFSYPFVNNTQALKDFNITLITTLASNCFGDSTRTIRISPVPTSAFTIDTVQFDCNVLRIRVAAEQKGLSSYHWRILENGIPTVDLASTQSEIEQTFNRPAGVDITAQISLDTKNFANCLSTLTTHSILIPKKDNINTAFTATPVSQSLPASTVTITNNTNPGPWSYQWDFGDGQTSTDPLINAHTYSTYGFYTIRLTVTHNVCVETQTQQIEILAIPPMVNFSYDPASGCTPLTVNFTNLSQFADPSTYQWNFGDQATSKMIDPIHTYYQPGKYSVSLSASNVTGQTITETKQAIIEVFPRPDAEFETKPKLIYIPGGILYTDNRSFNATRFVWDFGDGSTTTEFEPEHKYKEEGFYSVKLIAINQYECADTTIQQNSVKVQKGGQVLIPNAFSPGQGNAGTVNDGKNDVFLPLMRGVAEFELLIFNRWGELLFESRDPEFGWDGTYKGKPCQQDVYIYKLAASYETGEKVVRVGDVNLIR
jgi:gliding motility-associated-like protein